MKKKGYEVTLYQTRTYSKTIEVEAHSEQEARNQAQTLIDNGKEFIPEFSNYCYIDTWITDIEESYEIDD
jgi:hypothetical protein